MKRFILLVHVMLVSLNMPAQMFWHDEFKMQQFLVGETGVGYLLDVGTTLPPFFYTVTMNKSYQKTANAFGKQLFRVDTELAAKKQKEYSDSIKSYMKTREQQEVWNFADRYVDDYVYSIGGDGALLANSLMTFKNNIEFLLNVGGTSQDKEEYTDYYNMYKYGIEAVHKSSMPNNERKIAYQGILKDIKDKNHQLIKYMVSLRQIKLGRLATQRANYKRQVAVTACLNRWRSKWIGGSGSDSTTTNK